METSQTVTKISIALLSAQKEMSNATKDAKNPYFKSKYADLNSIREAAQPVLNKNGITVLQPMVQKDGKTYVRTVLLHESGEFISGDTEVVCAKANDPQAYGSGVTYARRYGLQSLVSLGAEDDDAEAAMGRTTGYNTGKATKTRASSSIIVAEGESVTLTAASVNTSGSVDVTTKADVPGTLTSEVQKSSFANGAKKLGKKSKETATPETPSTDDWQ